MSRPRAAAIVSLVLFDIDGTLISAFGAGLRSLQEAFGEVFERPDAAGSLPPHWFAGRNDLWIFREVALAVGVPASDYERRYPELEAAYLRRLRENMRSWKGARVLPGVRELLEKLSSDGDGGRDLGLVTGNLEEGARIKLSAFGLEGFFPAGGYGTDAAERQEIARIARLRFERRKGRSFPPGEIALVGDTVHDIIAATACGYRSVAVATGTTPSSALAATAPDLLMEDLSDPAPLLELLGARPDPDHS